MPCRSTKTALILLCGLLFGTVNGSGDDVQGSNGAPEYVAAVKTATDPTASGNPPAAPAADKSSTDATPNPLAGTSSDAAGAAPGAAASSSSAGVAKTPGNSGTAPWIWQGSDNTPVQVNNRRPQRLGFNPFSDSGLGLHVNGNANLGYSSQTQNAAPAYTNFNGGLNLNAGGFIYNPRLVSFTVMGSYDRTDMGFADRDSGGNGLSYGATLSLLQATPAPFSISYRHDSSKLGGTLTTPFSFDGRSLDLTGTVQKLPVKLSYHLGGGSTGTMTADGHDFGYRYRTGDIAISKKLMGFDIRITDDYLRSRSQQTLTDGLSGTQLFDLSNTAQTNNNLRLNMDREFGSRVTLYADGTLSKYRFESINSQSTDANLASFGAGVRWKVTDKLDASFSGTLTRNAVNILQLLSQSTGVSFPNPLPGIIALNTSSRNLSSMATYRPSSRWTFGTTSTYNVVALPPGLGTTTPGGEAGLTNRVLSNEVSAAYNRRVWKFDYNGGVSGGLQNYWYASGKGGVAKIFNVTNGINGGDERLLRYSARFTIDQTDNPVFFSLLNTKDRILEVLLARQARFVRLNARVGYDQREIEYAESRQRLNGLNLMVAASLSTLNVTASHYVSDSNQQFFGLLPPLGSGTGITPPPVGLLMPLVLANSASDSIAASWRARNNLQIDSRYTRFAFTVTGQNEENRESWFDESVQYHLGRFDIIGGFIHATGHTATSDRRMNRLYFRIRFPFQLW